MSNYLKRLTALGIATVAGVAILAGTHVAIASDSGAGASAVPQTVLNIRDATDPFHDIATAEIAGYGRFQDINGVSCIAMSGMGGMGVHWVNGDLVGDGKIDPLHPEALVYAPDIDGTLRLAAVEYIVTKEAWDATHSRAPRLLGTDFDFTDAPNRFGLPAFYSLHVWAWQDNPDGLTLMWNKFVHCVWA
jgi:hypothetical protein